MRAKLFAFLLATSPACVLGGSQVYQQDAQGGVLVLQGNETDALKDADARMTAHCGVGRFVVVRRETIVVGNEQYVNNQSGYAESADRQALGVAASQTQTTTSDQLAVASGSQQEVAATPYGAAAVDEQHLEATSASQSTTSSVGVVAEGESAQRTGQAASSSVSGSREVREQRLHYTCR